MKRKKGERKRKKRRNNPFDIFKLVDHSFLVQPLLLNRTADIVIPLLFVNSVHFLALVIPRY